MTQEEKELLLKDICARLPYSTLVYAQNDIDWHESEICTQVLSDVINDDYVVKPYLFPLSSMTEEQKKAAPFESSLLNALINGYISLFEDEELTTDDLNRLFDWLNKNHFDYRGLIEKGLAIDCTNLNVY
jgi:hypothetical protein